MPSGEMRAHLTLKKHPPTKLRNKTTRGCAVPLFSSLPLQNPVGDPLVVVVLPRPPVVDAGVDELVHLFDAQIIRDSSQEPRLQLLHDRGARLAGEAGQIRVQHLHLDQRGDALDVPAGLQEAADKEGAEVLVSGGEKESDRRTPRQRERPEGGR